MIFKVRFETNFGQMDFYWRGGEIVELYTNDDELPYPINPFNYEQGKLPFKREIGSFADYCRWYLWEFERGIDIFTITAEEFSSALNPTRGNKTPS